MRFVFCPPMEAPTKGSCHSSAETKGAESFMRTRKESRKTSQQENDAVEAGEVKGFWHRHDRRAVPLDKLKLGIAWDD